MGTAPEYVVVGHVTRDLCPDGSWRVGGTATYAALAASRLGYRVGVVTRADPQIPLFADQPGIVVHRQASLQTTTFENAYVEGRRRQRLHAVAAPLGAGDVPDDWRSAGIVHLGPVAQEVSPDLAHGWGDALLGVTPQGWMRRWDERGIVEPAPWCDADRVLSACCAVVLSLEDLAGRRDALAPLLRQARLLVLTAGREGAYVFDRGREHHSPAYLVDEADATGAGDVFAAAFFIRLREMGDPLAAARFANCAASFSVQGAGTARIPTREQIEHRLRYGTLRKDGR